MHATNIEDYSTVRNWFRIGKYSARTKKDYRTRMTLWCEILEKTPDQLIDEAMTTTNLLALLEKLQKKIARYYTRKKCLIKTIDHRLDELHNFYRYNGIPISRKDVRELRHATYEVYNESN